MSDARSTYRYAAMIAGGSVLVVGAVIVSNMDSAKTAPSADSTSAAEARQPDESAFAQWADDDSADGKDRLTERSSATARWSNSGNCPMGLGQSRPVRTCRPTSLLRTSPHPRADQAQAPRGVSSSSGTPSP